MNLCCFNARTAFTSAERRGVEESKGETTRALWPFPTLDSLFPNLSGGPAACARAAFTALPTTEAYRIVKPPEVVFQCPSGIHCSSDNRPRAGRAGGDGVSMPERHLLHSRVEKSKSRKARHRPLAAPLLSTLCFRFSRAAAPPVARTAFTALPISTFAITVYWDWTFQCPNGIHCSSDRRRCSRSSAAPTCFNARAALAVVAA